MFFPTTCCKSICDQELGRDESFTADWICLLYSLIKEYTPCHYDQTYPDKKTKKKEHERPDPKLGPLCKHMQSEYTQPLMVYLKTVAWTWTVSAESCSFVSFWMTFYYSALKAYTQSHVLCSTYTPALILHFRVQPSTESDQETIHEATLWEGFHILLIRGDNSLKRFVFTFADASAATKRQTCRVRTIFSTKWQWSDSRMRVCAQGQRELVVRSLMKTAREEKCRCPEGAKCDVFHMCFSK